MSDAGPPQVAKAPSGGREPHAVGDRGGNTPSLHDWLMSDRPQSRRQASLGRAYGAWRTFAHNRLAMLGLGIVLALVVIAILADVLAPFSPYIGDLETTRPLPPSQRRHPLPPPRLPLPKSRPSSRSL